MLNNRAERVDPTGIPQVWSQGCNFLNSATVERRKATAKQGFHSNPWSWSSRTPWSMAWKPRRDQGVSRLMHYPHPSFETGHHQTWPMVPLYCILLYLLLPGMASFLRLWSAYITWPKDRGFCLLILPYFSQNPLNNSSWCLGTFVRVSRSVIWRNLFSLSCYFSVFSWYSCTLLLKKKPHIVLDIFILHGAA